MIYNPSAGSLHTIRFVPDDDELGIETPLQFEGIHAPGTFELEIGAEHTTFPNIFPVLRSTRLLVLACLMATSATSRSGYGKATAGSFVRYESAHSAAFGPSERDFKMRNKGADSAGKRSRQPSTSASKGASCPFSLAPSQNCSHNSRCPHIISSKHSRIKSS